MPGPRSLARECVYLVLGLLWEGGGYVQEAGIQEGWEYQKRGRYIRR